MLVFGPLADTGFATGIKAFSGAPTFVALASIFSQEIAIVFVLEV
jgi:hypothetical protein